MAQTYSLTAVDAMPLAAQVDASAPPPDIEPFVPYEETYVPPARTVHALRSSQPFPTAARSEWADCG